MKLEIQHHPETPKIAIMWIDLAVAGIVANPTAFEIYTGGGEWSPLARTDDGEIMVVLTREIVWSRDWPMLTMYHMRDEIRRLTH